MERHMIRFNCRIAVALIVALVLFAALPSTVAQARSRAEWETGAVVRAEAKEWRDMRDWCRQWTEDDPEHAGAWVFLGFAQGRLKRYSEAIEAYHRAVSIAPDYAEAWYNLGTTYYYLNRNREAVDAYRRLLRIEPDRAGVWFYLGVSYGKLNRYDDEIEAYRQAVRIAPEYVEAWFNLGIAYHLVGNRSAALDVVRELHRIDPARATRLSGIVASR
ncbi:MAG: tetratricopeptide repeat protein [Syntrophales bacterium]|nr:tetratricopeptide repeat protein [Syntrophales bacterium]MCK9528796.1 tetratricopeptide repeat protein [Syntrophales bacterium]MDX9922743.1 tetratricopeptide repeat protein [Syntrophales bacterium]